MNIQKLKQKIIQNTQIKKVFIHGDTQHVYITAIGDIFSNMSDIQKQKIIYQPLTKYIMEKKIHAITINTFTELEWIKKNKNNINNAKYQ
ncbi:Acid stress protein IbaG [Buchnera aphidicola (Myzocallis carpini)]